MAKVTAALIGGILIGALTMIAADRFEPSREQQQEDVVRDIADVPKMTQDVAEKHRDESFVKLTRVEEVIALPTEFARSEAMHALAGRSDSAGVQNLIFETNRIADTVERVNLLDILFFRLAETDPQSALVLAKDEQFNSTKTFEQTVWRVWARSDLEEALFAARMQASIADQNMAAQSLYAAFGYMGNETTERIQAELGIDPDRATRSRYLYQLADRSPAEAIGFINGLERGSRQEQYVSWLAYYMSLRDPDAALRYADLFSVASDGEYFSSIINREIARDDPRATIERLLAEGAGRRARGQYHNAARELARTDMELAKQYFEQARSRDVRQSFGRAIATEMVHDDPVAALAWARSNDKDSFSYLEMSVISQIARSDPQLALVEASNTPKLQMRSNLISNVLQQIAQQNPAEAVVYLNEIDNNQQKMQATQQLASMWIRHDPGAAIDWILGQDKETIERVIHSAASSLINNDIDAAIQLLPRLSENDQDGVRQMIAQKLATHHSPEEAQVFIQQFEGQPGYDQLQSSLISGVAKTDVLLAKQLADQLSEGIERDRAYMQVILQRAHTKPDDAANWLRNIQDDGLRSAATGQIAGQWFEYDPGAAFLWVDRLPNGSPRDDAIVHMSYQWRNITADQEKLIASIEDQEKRGQAKIRQVYIAMRNNPAKARRLLDDPDISSKQRQEAEMMIAQSGAAY